MTGRQEGENQHHRKRAGERSHGTPRAGAIASAGVDEVPRAPEDHPRAAAPVAGRAVLEPSAQPAMVELFGLDRAIRYRQGSAQVRRAGQRGLANAIHEHLCRGKAGPRLREDGALGELLYESERLLPDDALRDWGDRLEALICAYAAARVDARREIQALGIAGEGVTILPNARGIAPA